MARDGLQRQVILAGTYIYPQALDKLLAAVLRRGTGKMPVPLMPLTRVPRHRQC